MYARREFDSEPASAAAVRAFVREFADVDLSHAAVLVASELAANAVAHAKTRFIVTIHSDGNIRLGFSDLSAELLRLDGSNDSHHGGLGLQIVDALSMSWGVAATPTGKQVWAEVATAAPEAV